MLHAMMPLLYKCGEKYRNYHRHNQNQCNNCCKGFPSLWIIKIQHNAHLHVITILNFRKGFYNMHTFSTSFYIIIGWTLIFIVVVSYKRFKANLKNENAKNAFWNRENAANSTRKQDISQLDYVDFSSVSLPFALFQDELLKECEEQVLKLKDKKILNLTGLSNTDLKLKYGPANLPLLTQYDQNFTLLVRTLNTWGKRLNELSHTQEAICVLAFAASIGSDIKATWALLAELYHANGDTAQIRELKTSAAKLNSLMKDPILTMLDSYL